MSHQQRPRYRRQDDQERAEEQSAEAALDQTGQESRTQQGPAHECDINTIAKAFGLSTRNMPIPPEVYDARYYGDMSDVPDLQTALNRIREATDHFMALPPKLRQRFGDNPGNLWAFVNDPQNADEAVALGLLRRVEDRQPEGQLEAKTAPSGAEGGTQT